MATSNCLSRSFHRNESRVSIWDAAIVCHENDIEDAEHFRDMVIRLVTFRDGSKPQICVKGSPDLYHTSGPMGQLAEICNCPYVFVWVTHNMACAAESNMFVQNVVMSKIEHTNEVVAVYKDKRNKNDTPVGLYALHSIDLSQNNQSITETTLENVHKMVLDRIKERMMTAFNQRTISRLNSYSPSAICRRLSWPLIQGPPDTGEESMVDSRIMQEERYQGHQGPGFMEECNIMMSRHDSVTTELERMSISDKNLPAECDDNSSSGDSDSLRGRSRPNFQATMSKLLRQTKKETDYLKREINYVRTNSSLPQLYEVVDKIKHTVAFAMEVTNYTKHKLKKPKCHPRKGSIKQQPQDIPPDGGVMRVIGHKRNGWTLGTYGTMSWEIEGLRKRIMIMYCLPYYSAFFCNHLAIGICDHDKELRFSSMYHEPEDSFTRGKYYRECSSIEYTCDQAKITLEGTMGTDRKTTIEIKVKHAEIEKELDTNR